MGATIDEWLVYVASQQTAWKQHAKLRRSPTHRIYAVLSGLAVVVMSEA
jgi:hypothetical protein